MQLSILLLFFFFTTSIASRNPTFVETTEYKLWPSRPPFDGWDEAALEEEENSGNHNIGHVHFLTENYIPALYFFESVDCVRRLLLAAIVGIVSEDAAAAPVIGIIVATAFGWIFTNFKPFKEDADNMINEIMAFALLFFFVAALMIKSDMTSDDEEDEKTFGFLLVFILVSAPLFLMLVTVSSSEKDCNFSVMDV